MLRTLEATRGSLPAARQVALLSWGPGEGPNPEPTNPAPHEPGSTGFRASREGRATGPLKERATGGGHVSAALYVSEAYVPPGPDDDQTGPSPIANRRRGLIFVAQEHESKPYDTEGDAANWAAEEMLQKHFDEKGK